MLYSICTHPRSLVGFEVHAFVRNDGNVNSLAALMAEDIDHSVQDRSERAAAEDEDADTSSSASPAPAPSARRKFCFAIVEGNLLDNRSLDAVFDTCARSRSGMLTSKLSSPSSTPVDVVLHMAAVMDFFPQGTPPSFTVPGQDGYPVYPTRC